MVSVAIPGPDAIQNVGVASDPGVQATPSDFGAQADDALSKFGNVLASIGYKLHEQRQNAADKIAVDAYSVNANENAAKAFYQTQQDMPGGGTGADKSFADNYNKLQQGTLADVTSKFGPSDSALQSMKHVDAQIQANYGVKAITWGHNEQINVFNQQANTNLQTTISQVAANPGALEDGLTRIDQTIDATKSFLPADVVEKSREVAHKEAVSAAIQSELAAGNLDAAKAIQEKYFGSIPAQSGTGVDDIPHAPPINFAGQAKAETAIQHLQSLGWSKTQAAGIVGGLMGESGWGLNTGAFNPNDPNGGSHGLGQWNGKRLADLKVFATERGKPWTDFQTQLDFVDHELRTTEGAAGARLKAADTPQDAAAAMLAYERPAGWDVPGKHPERLANTLRLLGLPAAAGGNEASADTGTPAQVSVSTSAALLPDADLAVKFNNVITARQRDVTAQKIADEYLNNGVPTALATPENAQPNAGVPTATAPATVETASAPAASAPAGSEAAGAPTLAQTRDSRANFYATKANILSDVSKRFANDPKMEAAVRERVNQGLTERLALQQAQEQDRLANQSAAMDDYLRPAMQGQPIAPLVQKLANDPRAEGIRDKIYNALQTVGHGKAYGSSFYTLFQKIHANGNGQITDPATLLPMVDGEHLTLEGYDKLRSEMGDAKSVDTAAMTDMRKSTLSYIKHNLTFEADYGTFKLRDPVGEDIFNSEAVPAFYKAYTDGLAHNKTPYQLLTKGSPDFIGDKIISTFKRAKAQEMKDRIAAGADALNAGTTAAPAPKFDLTKPAGIVGAYKAGNLTYAAAAARLRGLGIADGAAPVAVPAGPQVPVSQ